MSHSIIWLFSKILAFAYDPFSFSVTSDNIGFRQELNVQITVLNFVF